MWKYCLFVSAFALSTVAGDILLSDYSISPSNQVSYYHYPAPPKSQQIAQPPPQVRQYQQSAAAPVLAYQKSYQYQNVQQQQLTPQQSYQQQQSRFSATGKTQYNNAYYRPATQATSNSFPASLVSQRFASPALENAAFTMALTNQGYAAKGNSPAASAPSSSTSSNLATSPAQLAILSASPASSANSLNVKLPLPFNITPLNIAPLPLQAGTPYSSLPRGVTSYGTVYPQRRRR